MKLQLFWPLKPFIVSQYWGENPDFYQKNYGMLSHNGEDHVGITGQTIYAAHDGIVTFTGEDGRGGLGVVVRTQEQYDYLNGQSFYKSIYWHILPNSFKVKPGDIVKAGTPLAQCDSTGFTGGSHLHFGLKPVEQGESDWQWLNIEQGNGWFGAINPESYWNGKYAADIFIQYQIID